MKKTLVLGASENPQRYSNLAIHKLRAYGHEVAAVGKREGQVEDVKIHKGEIPVPDLDTVTLYLNPANQKPYYDYIIGLKPRRIIFNPGTENSELKLLAKHQGIDTLEACTLVMLSTGQY
jgi:uncharacterized protein